MWLKNIFYCGFLCAALAGCGGEIDPALYCDDIGCRTPIHPKQAKRGYNKPYEIKDIMYVPQSFYELREEGISSFYGGTDIFHGRPTSTGDRFDQDELSAAHKTLPLPSVVRVTNLENGRALYLKVNDRGPFVEGRVIDVSMQAAKLLGFYRKGTARVRVETDVAQSLMIASGAMKEVDGNVFEVGEPLAPMPVKAPVKAPKRVKKAPFVEVEEPLSENETVVVARHSTRLHPVEVIEAGVFGNLAQAQKLRSRILKLYPHMPIKFDTMHFGSQELTRVLVGPLKDKSLGAKLLKQLINSGFKSANIL